MKTTLIANSKGQALLFVVVVTAIALTVGVNLSSRTISSVSRAARTDLSSMARAAAEGGAEKFLSADVDLDALANLCTNGVRTTNPSDCVVQYNDAANAGVPMQAVIKVERLDGFTSSDRFTFVLNNGVTKEINLDGYTQNSIDVCWDNQGTNDIYYFGYNEGGATIKGVLDRNSGLDVGGETSVSGDCGNVDLTDINTNMLGLRLTSVGTANSINGQVLPTGGATLPTQGFRITSVGELTSDPDNNPKATVVVLRSIPYLPGFFNFGIYSDSSFELFPN